MRKLLALAVCVASMCASLATSGAAWAGQGERDRSATAQPQQTVATKAGWTAPWPAGLVPRLDENRQPAVGQWSGELVLALDGAEVIRIEVYPNPAGKSLARWVQTEWQALTAGLLLKPMLANSKREPALQAALPAAPQRHPQLLTWLQLGPDMAHVVCHLGADPRVKTWCDTVLAQLTPRGSR